MKRIGKIGKLGVIVIALTLVSTLIVGSAMFTWYTEPKSKISVGRLWNISDNATDGEWNAERQMGNDKFFSNQTALIGGDSEELFWFNVTLSGKSNADKTLHFTITEFIADGVNVTLYYIDGGNKIEVVDDEHTLSPEDTVQFVYHVALDEYTPEADYETGILVEKN